MKEQVIQLAHQCGFDACRFASAVVATHRTDYLDWIEQGLHADMNWLARSPERRTDPRIVLPECRSIIVLACNYFQGDDVRELPADSRVTLSEATITTFFWVACNRSPPF